MGGGDRLQLISPTFSPTSPDHFPPRDFARPFPTTPRDPRYFGTARGQVSSSHELVPRYLLYYRVVASTLLGASVPRERKFSGQKEGEFPTTAPGLSGMIFVDVGARSGRSDLFKSLDVQENIFRLHSDDIRGPRICVARGINADKRELLSRLTLAIKARILFAPSSSPAAYRRSIGAK